MISAADFWLSLDVSLADGSCLAITLSDRRGDAVEGPDKFTIRPTIVKGMLVFQWAARRANRESHENVLPDQTGRRIRELLGSIFRHGCLSTVDADFEARMNRHGQLTFRRCRPTRSPQRVEHNRKKTRLLAEDVPHPFLVASGIMTPAGKVRASKQAKFRQINRFLELVDDVSDHLRPRGTLRIVDFGCGKSYLTFALHHLFTSIRRREVEIVGFDRMPDVVDRCSRLGKELGCRGLEFRVGEIADQSFPTPVDLAVSLHACDTATDDALARAVSWQATVILAVPCCQHELARSIRAVGMDPLRRHGILHEQFASLATDTLRAQALEVCGYKTQVAEFISPEHTTKNLLIRAVRRHGTSQADASAMSVYGKLKKTLGLGKIAVDRILAHRRVEGDPPVGPADRHPSADASIVQP